MSNNLLDCKYLLIQGFHKHQVVDALSDPGNIDITSDVDFEELALSGAQISNGKISLKLAEICNAL